MDLKAAIFDLDGTLLDSMGMWRRVGEHFLLSRGITPPPDLKKETEVLTFGQAAAYYAWKFPVHMTAEEVSAAWDDYISDQYRNVVQPKPGVAEYLDRLRDAGVKACVATLTDRRHVLPALKRLGLTERFEFVITVAEAGRDKRHPDIYFEAARRLGADVADSVVFEDSAYAVTTARRAGFRVCGVFDETSAEDEPEMRRLCSRFINSFGELLDEPEICVK